MQGGGIGLQLLSDDVRRGRGLATGGSLRRLRDSQPPLPTLNRCHPKHPWPIPSLLYHCACPHLHFFSINQCTSPSACTPHATPTPPQTPPRGLQLHLGTPAQPHVVDTLVMANLAYFQLKVGEGETGKRGD